MPASKSTCVHIPNVVLSKLYKCSVFLVCIHPVPYPCHEIHYPKLPIIHILISVIMAFCLLAVWSAVMLSTSNALYCTLTLTRSELMLYQALHINLCLGHSVSTHLHCTHRCWLIIVVIPISLYVRKAKS